MYIHVCAYTYIVSRILLSGVFGTSLCLIRRAGASPPSYTNGAQFYIQSTDLVTIHMHVLRAMYA